MTVPCFLFVICAMLRPSCAGRGESPVPVRSNSPLFSNHSPDREVRDKAAALIRQHLDGRISGGQFEEEWPESPTDRALDGIGREILPEVRGGMFGQEYTDEHRGLLKLAFERTELFLGTDLPYAWGALGAGGCATLGCTTVVLVIATGTIVESSGPHWVGLVLIAATIIVALVATGESTTGTSNPERIRSIAEGKLRCWPFETEDDLRAVLEGRDPFEAAERETLDQ